MSARLSWYWPHIALVCASALIACGDDGAPSALVPAAACTQSTDCVLPTDASSACVTFSCTDGRCIIDTEAYEGLSCVSEDECITDAICQAGRCQGQEPDCDDGNVCTRDTHDVQTCECLFTPEPEQVSCDDGQSCTVDDRCDGAGGCIGTGSEDCECVEDADCATQDQPNQCFGPMICTMFRCALDPSTEITCADELGTECATPVCEPSSGACVLEATRDGEACTEASDPCLSVGPLCDGGLCLGSLRDCDDGKVCTLDSCIDGACIHTPDCDDGDPCTEPDGDGCASDGSCRFVAKSCDDDNVCTEDSCDGGCVHAAQDGLCDDQDPCTVGDYCEEGACTSGNALCDDDAPCTIDTCLVTDSETVCEFTDVLDGEPCDDGDLCTQATLCEAGQCIGVNVCDCALDSDCAQFEDGDPCTGTLVCDTTNGQGSCVTAPETLPECSDSGTQPCVVNACVSSSGECELLPADEGAPCPAEHPCILSAMCVSSECRPLEVVVCEDGDSCTADLCEEGACSFEALDQGAVFLDVSFDEGLPEGWQSTSNTSLDWVLSGAHDVDEQGSGMLLTVEGLGAELGASETSLITPEFSLYGDQVSLVLWVWAELGEESPFADFFVLQVSSYGAPPVTVPLSKIWQSQAWTRLEVDLSAFSNQSVALYLTVVTNSVDNEFVQIAVDDLTLRGDFRCDDGLPCSDGGLCLAGQCSAGDESCDDDNPCTLDECLDTGCEHTPLWVCGCEQDSDCDTANPCINDVCEQGACQAYELTGACDDDSLCTQGDQCVAGVCTGESITCADGDLCTEDDCDPQVGCVFPFGSADCDDNDPCTVDDLCTEGDCVGVALDCGSTECAQGTCVNGDCEFSIVHDGQIEYTESFDGIAPQSLPSSWDSSGVDPLWSWLTVTEGAHSPPNALTVSGPTTGNHPSALSHVTSAAVTIGFGGAVLTYWVNAQLDNGACFKVKAEDALLDELCTSTEGWQERTASLDAFAGDALALDFELSVEAGPASATSVQLDDVTIAGRYLCDDGDACTNADSCVFGLCVGETQMDCP